ncbi:MAG: sugar ABC transporter substrate-binding protein [Christensenellales bacterium]|jgi:ribose transport system substrate-binding protein
MKKVLVLLLALLLTFAFTACRAPGTAEPDDSPAQQSAEAPEKSEEPAKEPEKTDDGGDEPAPEGELNLSPELQAIYDKLEYKPVPNTTGEEFTIAVLCVMNNSFWYDVVDGIDEITKLLADPVFNTKVEMITIEAHEGQLFAEAIDNCVTKGYDAISTVGTSEAIIPAVNRAVDEGIPVYTFNSDVIESKRTAFVGQNLYDAGVLAGETMAQLIGGEGQVAVITGYFTVPAHEDRRLGALESFDKYPDIEIVSEVENHDSNDEGYSYTKDFLTAYPDLKGIYITAGGQQGVTKALSEYDGEIKVVMFDFMEEVIDAIYAGDVDATIGQDPYAQGANPVVFAYNEQVTGTPEFTGNVWTQMDIVTPDNVEEYFPR